jgi:hypothetical protein
VALLGGPALAYPLEPELREKRGGEHFTLSAAGAFAAGLLLRVVLPESRVSAATAGGLVFAAGFAKELGDTGFSTSDLALDAAGAALGSLASVSVKF